MAIAFMIAILGVVPAWAVGRTSQLHAPRLTGTVKPLSAPGGFTVKASDGYSMFVFGSPAHLGKPAAVGIFVTGSRGGAIYSAPATVTETSIQANLGELGEISVTFHPSGRARVVRPKCGGKPVSFDSGAYEGTIDFHGEEGFTEIETTRASGDLGFLLDLLCPGISGVSGGGPFLPGAELDVEANGPRPGPHLNREGPYLKVVKNRPSARAHFEVGVSEKTDGVSIERFTGLIASAHTFEYDPKVQTAALRPPAPFSGTAHFRRDAKPANRWTGDLTVDLPGKAGVKLTGGNLSSRLAHAHWEWHADAAAGSKRPSLVPPDFSLSVDRRAAIRDGRLPVGGGHVNEVSNRARSGPETGSESVAIGCGAHGSRVHPWRCFVTGPSGGGSLTSVYLVHLRWSNWGGLAARARGFILDPEKETRWPVRVLVHGRTSCDGRNFYRSLRLGNRGRTELRVRLLCPS